MQFISENNAAMKAKCTCLIDIEEKVATIKAENGLLNKSNAELLFLHDEKDLKMPGWETVLSELSLPFIWESLFMLKKQFCHVIGKWFQPFVYLLQSYKEVEAGVVRTCKN